MTNARGMHDAMAEMQRMQREMLEDRWERRHEQRMRETIARVQALVEEHAAEFPRVAAWLRGSNDGGARTLIEDGASMMHQTGVRPCWAHVFRNAERRLSNLTPEKVAELTRLLNQLTGVRRALRGEGVA